MSRTRTALLLGSLLIAGLAAPVAAASPAGRVVPAGQPLASTVVLSGAADGYVSVEVPKAASLGDPFHEARRGSVKIEGGGRMAGFALVQEGFKGPMIVGGKSAFSAPYAAERGEFVYNLQPTAAAGSMDFALPAGKYRLYLLADGKPTKVTLRINGLTGSARLAPTTRVRPAVQSGPPSVTTGATGVQSRGFDNPVSGPSLMLQVFGLRTSVHTETAFGICLHLRKPRGDQAYLPGCVSQDGNVGGGVVILISDESVADELRTAYGIAYLPKGGHFGAGMSATTASVVTDADYAHFFLPLGT